MRIYVWQGRRMLDDEGVDRDVDNGVDSNGVDDEGCG